MCGHIRNGGCCRRRRSAVEWGITTTATWYGSGSSICCCREDSRLRTSWETGNDIAQVLGLESTLTERWAQGETMRVPRERVGEVLGAHEDAVIERLVSMGLARIEGNDCVLTEPELLRGFAELRQFGFGLGHLLDVHADTERLMRQVAVRIIGEAKDQITAEHGEGWMPEGDEIAAATDMLQRMRTIGSRSVQIALGRAMDQALQDELGAYVAQAMAKGRVREK